MIKNSLSYPGNKNRLLKEIVPELPETKYFIDVFCGSGVVGANSKSSVVIANDFNEWTIAILRCLYEVDFRCLVDKIEKIISKYGLSYSRVLPKGFYVEKKHEGLSVINREGYLKLKDDFNNNHDIFSLIVLCIYGFNHYLRFNKNGEFNVPVGKVDFSKSIYTELEKFVNGIKDKKFIFLNFDFRNSELYKYDDAIYYFDPPYLITTAPYNEGWSERDEKDLLRMLDSLNENNKKFVLSNLLISNGKRNELLIEWSKKYNTINVHRQYRNANYQKINITDTEEVIIKNF